jgi:hypothetical protein
MFFVDLATENLAPDSVIHFRYLYSKEQPEQEFSVRIE